MKRWILWITPLVLLSGLAVPLSGQEMDMKRMHEHHHMAEATPSGGAYVPGLGEFMAAQQVRHAKLWFAGGAANWPLADYEVSELKEGFEQAIALHPTHDGMEIASLIRSFVLPRLADLEATVKAGRAAEFPERFDRLSAGCNECHRALGHPFIAIQRPTAPPFTNQAFAPTKP